LTQMFNDKLKAEVGLTLSIDIHDKTKAYVFPQAEFKYSLFNDIFIPFAGIRGGLKQNSYRSLSTENQFVLVNIPLANESTPFDIYGGFKGTITKKLSFNLNASFAKVMNKAFFVTDTLYSVGNKFGVVYDTMNLTKVEGSLAYQLNEKIKIDAIARYFSYETKNQAFAWNLPIFQFVLRGSYNLFDKFLVNLDANLEGGRKALVYGPGENIFIENNQYYQNLGFIADVNLGLEYRYNKRISAFLQVNNLASQRYYRWYNYPVQPIQVMGGITARF
jgi:outer membrane receptor protein involved in Fe transport